MAPSGPVRAVFAPADEATPGVFPQVGYAIGRRCGSAVVRNRLRRRARAVVREAAPSLPRGAFLVRLDPARLEPERGQLRHDLAEALRPRRRGGRTVMTDTPTPEPRLGPPARVAVALLRAYQGAASGRVSPCRFYPSCSNYAVEAFRCTASGVASALTARRLLRCRPFGPHGVDLVPIPVHAEHHHRHGRGQPC